MIDPGKRALWDEFLELWPVERVRAMTLEEYTNSNQEDAFIYWLEKKLEDLGSIWGGSAFKFGIYARGNTEAKESNKGMVWGERYAWLTKFGATEQAAFATIRAAIVDVIEAVQEGNLARIHESELSGVLKWKVAFLYQDRARPVLFPVFKKEALFFHYRTIDPRAKYNGTPRYVMYQTLMERHRGLGDPLEIGRVLWSGYLQATQGAEKRAWAIPLAWTIDNAADIDELCGKTKVEPEDIDPFLDGLLASGNMSEGDEIALLVDGEVRAVGELTSVEAGQFSWEQTPVRFPSPLLVNPTSQVKLLDAAERKAIWSLLPAEPVGGEPAPEVQYWKVAPGKGAVAWDDWRTRGFAAIGWPKLGDLSALTEPDFKARAERCRKEDGYTPGMSQVWVFRNIRVGDRIVANHGFHTALGIGTVTRAYYFEPGTHTVHGEDFPHRLGVRWDDTTPRRVKKNDWISTLDKLSKSEFDEIVSAPPVSEGEAGKEVPPPPPPPPAGPCTPENIILYGPPGTGKTYSTVRRALELIVGEKQLEGLGEKGLMAMFRDFQAKGVIEFVTFHQAYGYEEFVEGIRPVMSQAADAQVRYEVHDGVFKRIALRAAADGLRGDVAVPEFDELWDQLVRELERDGSRTAKSASGKTYELTLSNQGSVLARACDVDAEGNVTVTGRAQVASRENARLYWRFRAELGPEPEKITYDKTTQLFAREKGGAGGNHFTALWIVYTQLLEASRVAGPRKADLIDPIRRVQQALDKPGPTTTFSFDQRTQQYVLIIDEINRGNVSKILGELITLLEPDKRLTARAELKLPLSYTPAHKFGVPPNLHVLGTMNTADRSIALMDVALRRRFTFEELMPDAGVIREVLAAKVPDRALIELVADVFEALNDRIRFLYDADHQLGHSYFLDVADIQGLRRVFVDRVVPLLQEYFYGAWDKICIVLGCPYDEAGRPRREGKQAAHLFTGSGNDRAYAHPIIVARTFPEVRTLGFDHQDHEDRVDHHVRPGFRDGTLATADLHWTFLGLLPLDADGFTRRLAELSGEPGDAAAAVSSQAVV